MRFIVVLNPFILPVAGALAVFLVIVYMVGC
jgi:hypothetical protein